MGDFGSDAGQSALSLGTKALEAILRLFEKLFEAWRRNPERQLAKFQLKEAKSEMERQKILDRLQGKTGFVSYQDLKRSGEELSPIGIFMTKTEMKDFSALCKREGVQFSGMTDHTDKNSEGVKTYEIICKKKDLEKVLGIVDRLNDEKMIVGIDNRIAELQAKGDTMTEQDKVDIAALQEQKSAIQRSYCERLNAEMSNSVIERAVTGESHETLTLDEALNRLTGRQIDKDVVCIVADANDPSKYIKCHGYQDTYNDKPYIKTEYEVYRGTEQVLKTHDGRFDGRPKHYWNEQKAAIQQAGDFSGTFFKFYSVVEYQKWAEATRNQNTQELSSMVKEGERDYSGIIKELEEQLDKNGAKMQDGIVVDKETGEPLALVEGMSEEQRAIVAESMVIGKQINNYTELTNLDMELTVAEADVLTADNDTEEKRLAEEKMSEVKERHDTALETEQKLITERKEINAVQAEQEVRNAPEQTKTQEVEYLPEDKAKIEALEAKIAEQTKNNVDYTLAITRTENLEERDAMCAELKDRKEQVTSMKAELAQLKEQAAKNAQNAERPDDRRSERMDERDDKQMTMEEVKGQIAERRANEGAKQADIKDRNVHTHDSKAAVEKTTQAHADR